MRDAKMTCPKCGATGPKRFYPDGMVRCEIDKKRKTGCGQMSYFIEWYSREIQKEELKKLIARKEQMAE